MEEKCLKRNLLFFVFAANKRETTRQTFILSKDICPLIRVSAKLECLLAFWRVLCKYLNIFYTSISICLLIRGVHFLEYLLIRRENFIQNQKVVTIIKYRFYKHHFL